MSDITKEILFRHVETFFCEISDQVMYKDDLEKVFDISLINLERPAKNLWFNTLIAQQPYFPTGKFIGHIVKIVEQEESTMPEIFEVLKKYQSVFPHPMKALLTFFKEHKDELRAIHFDKMPRIICMPNLHDKRLAEWQDKENLADINHRDYIIPLIQKISFLEKEALGLMHPSGLPLPSDFLLFFTK